MYSLCPNLVKVYPCNTTLCFPFLRAWLLLQCALVGLVWLPICILAPKIDKYNMINKFCFLCAYWPYSALIVQIVTYMIVQIVTYMICCVSSTNHSFCLFYLSFSKNTHMLPYYLCSWFTFYVYYIFLSQLWLIFSLPLVVIGDILAFNEFYFKWWLN